MDFTSNLFILFLCVTLAVYYIVPRKMQWIILLIASFAFYAMADLRAMVFLVLACVLTYAVGRGIAKARSMEDKTAGKAASKRVFRCGLIGLLGILAVVKYTNFVLSTFGMITGVSMPVLKIILPVGISYYTFMAIGYLLDIYWGREQAEMNPFKLALFLSYFPHIMQGPIGKYQKLGPQFMQEHKPTLENFRYGFIRILWGLFKTMLLSAWAGVYSSAIFANQEAYSHSIIFGILLFGLELYCNFAGATDMIIGVSALFGITLDENFNQPFFATSMGDFWRRWHMSLGVWMKDYVMYPLTLSKGLNKVGKQARKIIGRRKGRLIPMCLTSIIVFLVVGIWHGAGWSFILWGLYNGFLVALGSLFQEDFTKIKKALHINDKAKWYRCFMIARNFLLVNLGWYIDMYEKPGDIIRLLKYSFQKPMLSEMLTISSGKLGVAYTPYALLTICIGVALLFIVGVYRERGVKIVPELAKLPGAVQFVMAFVFLFLIVAFCPMMQAGGFIYAQF